NDLRHIIYKSADLRLNRVGAFLLFVIFLGWSLYANLFSVTYRAKAAAFEQALHQNLDRLTRQILDADAIIVEAVKAQAALYSARAEASRAGRDDSGIAFCGSRCREASTKAAAIQTSHAGLIQSIAGPLAGASQASPAEAFALLERALALLAAKQPAYAAFCQTELGRACASPAAAIAEDSTYRELRSRFTAGEAVDVRVLITEKVARDLAAFAAGHVGADSLIALFQAVVPELLSWWLVLHPRFITAVPSGALHRRAKALREESAILNELLHLEFSVHTKKRLWAAFRRRARSRLEAEA
ncbi:MAG: hypothetical protein K2Q10_13435, partial [Rhodospirillales bacterium]|nr:hypothetical protein [Rhodospirillales bacterium]